MSCDVTKLSLTQLLIEIYQSTPSKTENKQISETLSANEAERELRDQSYKLSSVKGKVLNINLSHDLSNVDPQLYNARYGTHALENIISRLRTKSDEQIKLFAAIKQGNVIVFKNISERFPELLKRAKIYNSGTDTLPINTALIDVTYEIESSGIATFANLNPQYNSVLISKMKILDCLLKEYRNAEDFNPYNNPLHFLMDLNSKAVFTLINHLYSTAHKDFILALFNKENEYGHTPLIYCLDKKNTELFLLLLPFHNLCMQNSKGYNLLHYCVIPELLASFSHWKYSKSEIASLLLKVFKITDRKQFKEALTQQSKTFFSPISPLQSLVKKHWLEHLSIIEPIMEPDMLFYQGNSCDDANLFHSAAHLSRESTALPIFQWLYKFLPKKSVKSNGINDVWTPDFILLNRLLGLEIVNHPNQMLSNQGVNYELLDFIIRHLGLRLDMKEGYRENTLLHNAVLSREPKLVDYLLSNKADPNAQNKLGYTPLDLCDKCIAQLYLETNPHTKSNENGSDKITLIKESLLKAGAKFPKDYITPEKPSTPKELLELLQHTAEKRLTPGFTQKDLLQIEKDSEAIKSIFNKLSSECFYYLNNDELENLKAQFINDYFFFDKPEQCWDAHYVITFTNLTHAQKDKLIQLQKAIAEFNSKKAIAVASLELIEKTKTLFSDESTLEKLQKEYGNSNLLVYKSWFQDKILVKVFQNLDLSFSDKIKELQDLYNQYAESLKENWLFTLKLCQEKQLQSKVYQHKSSALKDYDRNHDVNGQFCLMSPEFPALIYSITRFDRMTADNKTSLDKILSITKPIIMRNRLGYELLHRKMHPKRIREYLSTFPVHKEKFADITLEFADLTKADDYQCVVNTILTKEENLRETLLSDPKFLETTPYVSMCLISKQTRGYGGRHHHNTIFPVYLGLDIPITSDITFGNPIAYSAPCDMGSPYQCRVDNKLDYLKRILAQRIIMDHIQALLQLKGLDREPPFNIPYSPFEVAPRLSQHPLYEKPKAKTSAGSIPSYTTDSLLRETNIDSWQQDSYTEIIGLCNGFQPKKSIEGRVLFVDKYFLTEYRNNTAKIFETKADAEACVTKALATESTHYKCINLLSQLTHPNTGRYRLVLIDTDMGAYRFKRSYFAQLELLDKEFTQLLSPPVIDTRYNFNRFANASFTSSYLSMVRLKECGKTPDPENVEFNLQCQRKFDHLKFLHNQLLDQLTPKTLPATLSKNALSSPVLRQYSSQKLSPEPKEHKKTTPGNSTSKN